MLTSRITRGIISVVILSTLLSNCNSSEKSSVTLEADRKKSSAILAEIATQFSAAYMGGDAEEMASLYTDDAVLFPNNSDFIRGKEAILKYWTLGPGRRITIHKITPVEIEFSGDMAYDFGVYEISGSNDEKPWGPNYGKYLIVWKKEDDGSWKMHLDMWNSRPAPQEN